MTARRGEGDQRHRGQGRGEPGGEVVTLRVVSWNVRSLRDDVPALLRVLHACRPDVLLLQEAPRLGAAAAARRRLARAAGLRVVAAGPLAAGCAVLAGPRTSPVPGGAPFSPGSLSPGSLPPGSLSSGSRPRGSRARRAEGAAVARLPPSTLLPWPFGLHRRGLALALVGTPVGPVLAASAHLGLDDRERRHHAALLADRLGVGVGDGPHVVLGVDVNEAAAAATPPPVDRGPPPVGAVGADGRTAGAWELLAAGGLDHRAVGVRTFPARSPRRSIDGLLASGLLQGRADVPGPSQHVAPADLRAASDHLPLLAVLRLRVRSARTVG